VSEGVLAFALPSYEIEKSKVKLRTAEGRELELSVREFARLKAGELAERLGLKFAPVKELGAWKSEILREYIGLQPLRARFRFALLREVYTRASLLRAGEELIGVDVDYRLWEAKVFPKSDPIFIIDKDGYVNPNRREYSLVDADPETIAEVVKTAPPEVKKLLKRVSSKKIGKGKEGKGAEEDADLVPILEEAKIVYLPAPALRSVDFLKEMDWRVFVEEALSFGAQVDPRLTVVRAVHALKGVEGRCLPHAILVANSGTGKSQFYKIWGQHWDKVTANTLIGYARAREEIYYGLIDGAEEAIAVDQIESADRANLVRYLLDYMEDGKCSFSAGGVAVEQEGRAPLVFIANPIGSGGEKDFQRTLEIVSFNPALGGRIAIIFYFTDLAVLRGSEEALGSREEEAWLERKSILRAVEDYCRSELRKVWRNPKVQDWLKQPIPNYRVKVNEIILGLESETLREFFENHASQASAKIRGAALQAALLYNLKDIALGSYNINTILEEAEDWLRKIVELNLASIANIVAEYEGKKEQNVRAFYESLPDYLKAAVAVGEAYRRTVLEAFRGRGQIPEQLRSVILEDLKASTEEFGYSYFSRALDRVKRRRKALERFKQISEYFGFALTLKEGPKPQVVLTVQRWEEAPVDLPQRLASELKEFLFSSFSPFLQFLHFSSSGEEGEKSPPTREDRKYSLQGKRSDIETQPSKKQKEEVERKEKTNNLTLNHEKVLFSTGENRKAEEGGGRSPETPPPLPTRRNGENGEMEKITTSEPSKKTNENVERESSQNRLESSVKEAHFSTHGKAKIEPEKLFLKPELKPQTPMRCPVCGRYYAATKEDYCPHCRAMLEDALGRWEG